MRARFRTIRFGHDLPCCWSPRPACAAQDDTEREVEKYRQMLKADPWSNPGLLDADRGEALWKEKRGPKNASLEQLRSRQRARARSRALSPNCRATSRMPTA